MQPAFTKSYAVTSILVSSVDTSIYVIQNGDIVIADPDKPLGSNVSMLEGANEDGFTWQQHRKKGAAKPNASVVERVKPTENVQAAIDERMKPGMVFVTTDQLATPDTHAAKDFTILDAEGVSGNEGGSSVLVTAP